VLRSQPVGYGAAYLFGKKFDYMPAPQAGLCVGGQFRFYADHVYLRTA
jgi:hypothetical protein